MRVIMIMVFLLSMGISAWTDRAIVAKAEQIRGAPWGHLTALNQDITGTR